MGWLSRISHAGDVAIIKCCILFEIQNNFGKELSRVAYKKRWQASCQRMLMTGLHGTPASLCAITFAFRCILRQLGNNCWCEEASTDSCLCINWSEYFHRNSLLCLVFHSSKERSPHLTSFLIPSFNHLLLPLLSDQSAPSFASK